MKRALDYWFDELTHKYVEFRMQMVFQAERHFTLVYCEELDDQYAKLHFGEEKLSPNKLKQFSAMLEEAKKDWKEYKEETSHLPRTYSFCFK